MKITQLIVIAGEAPWGNFNLVDEDTKLEIKLKPEEARKFFNMCLEIFQFRQVKIAENIAAMKQVALPAPNILEAEFDDVPF